MEKKIKIIGVIPARYASSRFPGKPLADIHGKPMIWWVYQQAKKVVELDEVVVATDDQRICVVCEQLNIPNVMTSNSHKTPNDRIHEVSTMINADIYVCINGDEPLIQPEVIKKALPEEGDELAYFSSNVITAIKNPVELADPSNIKAVFNKDGEALWISRSPIPFPKGSLDFNYYKIIGVAAFSKNALDFYANTKRSALETVEELDMYRFLEHGKKCLLKIADAYTLSVDEPKDLEYVREILSRPPPPCHIIRYRSSKWLKRSLVSPSFSIRRAA
ncbi:MAG: 3-deoxy-manno-octulosonate cytidylyltransferase [Treponema sp.]|jgi:3-deoxy-manno-octulosonate cytidylyltransferase (CMP-KDO synthetase)|nr:3-deoxy-manno-octulosonate cytidylyltransferase [Treponema sp.]